MPNETVSETIKALECCAAKTLLNSTCGNCPYGNRIFSGAITCTFKLSQDALNLINRQQAKIEALQMDNEQLQSDVINANMNLEHMTAEFEELEAEYEKVYEQAEADILGNLPQGGASCHWCIDKHKKYAIKEFAERLKAKKHECGCNYRKKPVYAVTEEKIDETYKEMVGDAE